MALTLAGAGLTAAPANAGDDNYVTVRAIDDRFEVVGQDCAGAPADPPDVKVKASPSPVPWRGLGAVKSIAAPGTVGGLLVQDPHPLRGVQYTVRLPQREVSGDAPQGLWRVEVNGETLTSDPVDLARGWTRMWLEDAVLHGPDGWTGSVEDYLAEFGKGSHWSAGLLTGPCLDSTEVWLDGIGTRHALYDFEPRTWSTVRVREVGPPFDGRIDAGDRFVVRAQAHRWDLRRNHAVIVHDADIDLQRRWTGSGAWRTVAHAATWHDTARRSASWRALWHDYSDNEVLQTSWAHASDPKVDGRACRPDPDVLPLPPTCRTVLVDAGTVVFSGTGTPAGAATVDVQVRTGSFEGPLVSEQQAVLGGNGRWRIAVGTGAEDHLYVEVAVSATSPYHELMGGGRMRFPLEVR